MGVPANQWRWFGDVGHFICGRWCRFHLCTEVGKYLVSTVGAYVHPSKSKGNEHAESKWLAENWPGEDVGCGRKYETMVFEIIGDRCADVSCGCGMPQVDFSGLDFRGYNRAGDAASGHMELCEKWAAVQSSVSDVSHNSEVLVSDPHNILKGVEHPQHGS